MNIKLLAATIGAGAVVAMGALGMALDQEQAGGDAVAKATPMTIGATSTQTTPSTAPATEMAVPSIKGPAPLPSEEAAAK